MCAVGRAGRCPARCLAGRWAAKSGEAGLLADAPAPAPSKKAFLLSSVLSPLFSSTPLILSRPLFSFTTIQPLPHDDASSPNAGHAATRVFTSARLSPSAHGNTRPCGRAGRQGTSVFFFYKIRNTGPSPPRLALLILRGTKITGRCAARSGQQGWRVDRPAPSTGRGIGPSSHGTGCPRLPPAVPGCPRLSAGSPPAVPSPRARGPILWHRPRRREPSRGSGREGPGRRGPCGGPLWDPAGPCEDPARTPAGDPTPPYRQICGDRGPRGRSVRCTRMVRSGSCCGGPTRPRRWHAGTGRASRARARERERGAGHTEGKAAAAKRVGLAARFPGTCLFSFLPSFFCLFSLSSPLFSFSFSFPFLFPFLFPWRLCRGTEDGDIRCVRYELSAADGPRAATAAERPGLHGGGRCAPSRSSRASFGRHAAAAAIPAALPAAAAVAAAPPAAAAVAAAAATGPPWLSRATVPGFCDPAAARPSRPIAPVPGSRTRALRPPRWDRTRPGTCRIRPHARPPVQSTTVADAGAGRPRLASSLGRVRCRGAMPCDYCTEYAP